MEIHTLYIDKQVLFTSFNEKEVDEMKLLLVKSQIDESRLVIGHRMPNI